MRAPAPTTKHGWVYGLAVLLLVAPSAPFAQTDEVVVIVNKNNMRPINRALITKIYTGATKTWPDGTPAVAVDQQTGSAARKRFYDGIIGKSHAAMRALWAQNIFAGRGLPPKPLPSDPEVLALVRTRNNAIGYVLMSQADDSVRVVKP